jgi:hypothetical protein
LTRGERLLGSIWIIYRISLVVALLEETKDKKKFHFFYDVSKKITPRKEAILSNQIALENGSPSSWLLRLR